jgi:hypothetical protein
MTPAQLGVLISEHNRLHGGSDGKHARTDPDEVNDGADLFAIAAMRRA